LPFFEWNDNLSIGIANIDNQHKQLFQMLNQLNDISDSSEKQEAAYSCLIKMKKYSEEHFMDEEIFMMTTNFPELDAHKKEHEAFIEKISGYEAAQKISYIPYDDMVNFLKEWLILHIQGSDMKIIF